MDSKHFSKSLRLQTSPNIPRYTNYKHARQLKLGLHLTILHEKRCVPKMVSHPEHIQEMFHSVTTSK